MAMTDYYWDPWIIIIKYCLRPSVSAFWRQIIGGGVVTQGVGGGALPPHLVPLRLTSHVHQDERPGAVWLMQ